MKKTFYSNGKILLTGEYLVLDGAKALAIPTQYGQSLEVESSDTKDIHWQSIDRDGKIWFEAIFYIKDNTIFSLKTPNSIQDKLLKILQTAKTLNPDFLKENENLDVKAYLNFDQAWGLGTSSSLVNNIAQWSETDAFDLLSFAFGGSGYDVAAAQHDNPILYTRIDSKPFVEEVILDWSFKNELYFVYLNKKQNSRKEVARYNGLVKKDKEQDLISTISESIISVKTRAEFEAMITQHEKIISAAIEVSPVKDQLFKDYPYAVKSLGAWGGDFILVCGTKKDMEYFTAKGYDTILPFTKMIK